MATPTVDYAFYLSLASAAAERASRLGESIPGGVLPTPTPTRAPTAPPQDPSTPTADPGSSPQITKTSLKTVTVVTTAFPETGADGAKPTSTASPGATSPLPPLSTKAKTGIIVGSIFGFLLLIGILFFAIRWWRRRKLAQKKKASRVSSFIGGLPEITGNDPNLASGLGRSESVYSFVQPPPAAALTGGSRMGRGRARVRGRDPSPVYPQEAFLYDPPFNNNASSSSQDQHQYH